MRETTRPTLTRSRSPSPAATQMFFCWRAILGERQRVDLGMMGRCDRERRRGFGTHVGRLFGGCEKIGLMDGAAHNAGDGRAGRLLFYSPSVALPSSIFSAHGPHGSRIFALGALVPAQTTIQFLPFDLHSTFLPVVYNTLN